MPRDYTSSPNPKKLYRSRTDKVIGGVCGGLAERFGWEPSLVRLAAIVTFFLSGGGGAIIAYIVAMIILPKEPIGRSSISPEEDAFWRGVSDRPNVTFGNLKYTFMDLEDRLQKLERGVTSEDWRLRKEFRDLERN